MCTLICLLYPISSLSHFYFFSFFFLVHPLFLDPGLADETFLELVLNLSPTYLALLSLLLQQTTFTFTRTLCFCFFFFLSVCAFSLHWRNFLYPTPFLLQLCPTYSSKLRPIITSTEKSDLLPLQFMYPSLSTY